MRAFPYLEDLVQYFLGVNLPLPVPMFGLMVALGVLAGVTICQHEIMRFEKEGLMGKAWMGAKTKQVPAHEIVSEFAMVAVISGLIGARLFHILEYPSEFMQDPIGMLFSRGGLTIFGAFIVGTAGSIIYLRRRRIEVWRWADAACLGMILGYAIGRIGCQIAGDGDWGIIANMGLKPDWLPTWFWAQTYDGNIVGEVISPPGVYPTPMYESILAFLIFGFLMLVRKHTHQAGWLFFLYVLLSGLERLPIESIRVNSTYELFGYHPTQAQLISLALIMVGIVGVIRKWPRRSLPQPN